MCYATNLLESTHDWIFASYSSCNVDVVYIDFSRALTFDSIVFSKLLTKLEHYGITGKLLNLISAFKHKKE